MERRRILGRSTALRLAGLVGIGTALYHGIEGASIVDAIDMSTHDKEFVSATYQLGTMGWLAMAVMLIGAAGFDSLKARSWVVWTAVALYGMPAFGTLVLTGGKPNVGGICLGLSVALALYGRGLDRSDAGARRCNTSEASGSITRRLATESSEARGRPRRRCHCAGRSPRPGSG